MAYSENTELIDRFDEFYQNYCRNEIGELAQKYPDEKKSLYIDWAELKDYDPDLADDVLTKPEQLTEFAEEALRVYDLPVDVSLGQANIRIRNLNETTPIREIRSEHHDKLISVPGTVRSASSVMSFPQDAAFECQRCGTLNRIPQSISADNQSLIQPQECKGCQRDGPFRINQSRSRHVNLRRLRVESSLADPTTESPESIVVIATDDLAEGVNPGDTVQVTGTVKLTEFGKNRPQLDATINDKYLMASSIEELRSGDLLELTEDNKREIVHESNDSDVYQRIVESIAPHVPGCEKVKLAVALQLFGGVKKELPDGTIIPGNIHVGLVADPGLFASEIVEYAARLAPKSVQVNGTDTTQVGLTSAAYKSSAGAKNWELDAGALVLADDGIACITRAGELDQDAHAALHTVMRDQEVKASKGTATQTLPADTTVLASLSPKYGRFDQYEPIGEQINLDPALISRFDLIFTLADHPDSKVDSERADQILQTNYAGEVRAQVERGPTSTVAEDESQSILDEVSPTIDTDLLRKYIAYSRRNCFPTMSEEAKDVIQEFYVSMREKGQDEDAPVPVTARKLEALVRLAEASARIRLADVVTEDDAKRVIELVEYCLKQIGIDPEVGEFDADIVETGDPEQRSGTTETLSKEERDIIQTVRGIIGDIEDEFDEGAPLDIVVEKVEEEIGLGEAKEEHYVEMLKQRGEVYEPRTDHLRTT